MKKALIIISLCVLGLSLLIFFAVKEILNHASINSNLHWGPEPRVVKVLSVNEVTFSAFYGFDLGAAENNIIKNSSRHYYRATALDVSSGARLNWKLNCSQKIQPPATMTYTPHGEASAPQLEIHAVAGGPFIDEKEALTSMGGVIPADEEMLHGFGSVGAGPNANSVFVLKRASIVSGSDFRSADPSINSYTGQREVQFTLTNEAGDRFYDYTSKNVGHYMAVVMNGRIREVAALNSAIRDRGMITGSFTQDEVAALSMMLRADALGKHRADNYGTLADAGIPNTQNHCSVSADNSFDFLRWITR
jgi:hypothetical protein